MVVFSKGGGLQPLKITPGSAPVQVSKLEQYSSVSKENKACCIYFDPVPFVLRFVYFIYITGHRIKDIIIIMYNIIYK